MFLYNYNNWKLAKYTQRSIDSAANSNMVRNIEMVGDDTLCCRAGRFSVQYLTELMQKKLIEIGERLFLQDIRQKNSLWDFGRQKGTQRVESGRGQVPAAVWTLLSRICPAQLLWNDLETAWGLGVVLPILWAVRGGWKRTETFTWFPRSLRSHRKHHRKKQNHCFIAKENIFKNSNSILS